MDVPGVTYTITVPTGKTQTLLFTITGYTIMTPVTGGGSSQGGAFLQDGVKISSAFSSSGQQEVDCLIFRIRQIFLKRLP
jgi:hypothetical protein